MIGGRADDTGVSPRSGATSWAAGRFAWAYLAVAVLVIVGSVGLSDGAQLALLSLVQVSGGVAVLVGLRAHRPRARWPWLALGAAGLLFGAGTATWFAYVEIGQQPITYPGWSDALFVPGYLAQVTGLALLVRERSPAQEIPSVLDAAILAVGLGFAHWTFLIGPASGATLSAPERAINLAYPAIDVVLVVLVARLLFAAGRSLPSLWLLAGGAVSTLGGDGAYATVTRNDLYQPGALPDQLWMLSAVLFGVAALHPSMRAVTVEVEASRQGVTRQRLVLLVAALMMAPVVLAAAALSDTEVSVTSGLVLGAAFGGLGSARILHLSWAMRRLVLADPLTGLANREVLVAALERDAPDARLRPGRSALLFIDLDHFKRVNDALGHAAGDAVLVEVGERLRGLVGPSDTVARISGDEFGILCRDLPSPDAGDDLAEQVVTALTVPYTVWGREVYIGASVGVVTLDGTDAETSLRNADLAMYVAKGAGRSRWQRFELPMISVMVEDLALDTELRSAIGGDQLVLHYQPIVDLQTARMRGVEALVRWQHPTRGLLMPSAFVPMTEHTGSVVALGRWVLMAASLQMAGWHRSRPQEPPLTVSVNVAAAQLASPDFVSTVAETLALTGLDPASLCLELTETAVLADPASARSAVADLRELGVHIAIDDFGTRYASLTYLQQLEVSEIKIDKSFIDGLGTKLEETTIVAAVVGLAKAMQLRVVAEGVETAEQLILLRDMGCDLAQGYHLSRPVPAAELTERLDAEWCGPGWIVPDIASADTFGPDLRVLPDGREAKRYRVLLADDDVDDRFLQRRALESTGRFEVVGEADDGAMAVRLAALHQPHLVLLDLKMPKVDGLSALPRLLLAAPGTQVVLVSGHATPGSVDRALAIGAAAFYRKDVTDLPTELLRLLEPAPTGAAAISP